MIESRGFAIVENIINDRAAADLAGAISAAAVSSSARDKAGAIYALRELCGVVPAVRELATSLRIGELVEPVLGPSAHLVRCLYFDKTPAANWKVPWHQDLSIAVRRRIDVPGFGPWSVKAGVPHVQPPVGVLERMLTVRLHLDDCHAENGPLRVVPASHRLGVLDVAAARRARAALGEIVCAIGRGGVMLMRPLILHASAAAIRPGHRRVIHMEFAAGDLPGGLEWMDQSLPVDLSSSSAHVASLSNSGGSGGLP